MAFPFGRTEHYSPLGGEGQPFYASPATMQQPWNSNQGDLGSPEFEMYNQQQQQQHRPNPMHRQSGTSFASVNSQSSATIFPSNQTSPAHPLSDRVAPPNCRTAPFETQSFLHDPSNKIDTSFSTPEYQPFKDHTGRQLRHLLYGSTSRFFITIALCAGYIIATKIWVDKGPIGESSKKIYNTITTALSLAIGLNISSAFKDMALNMRWPILAARKRNLRELDLFLRADSLTELFKLVFIARRFWVIIACLAWLFINLAAQAAIAMLSLTYSFDVNYDAILQNHGTIKVANMSHFFPNSADPQATQMEPSIGDEQFTANSYGGLAYNLYKSDTIDKKPQVGDIFKTDNPMLWWDEPNHTLEYMFSNEPTKTGNSGSFASYSERIINTTYSCKSWKVTGNGNGTENEIIVEDIDNPIYVASVVPEMTSYFTKYQGFEAHYYCPDSDNTRCGVIQAFEATATGQPWYYRCNITMGITQNDPHNISFVDDLRAGWAAAAIAQIGYTNSEGSQQTWIYPSQSAWGLPLNGDADSMGLRIATYALGSIVGAAKFGPRFEQGDELAPSQAFVLNLNHPYFFYLIIGLICGSQLLFCVVVAVLANRVKVGPEGHLSMSLLLRPIADALEGVSGGRENKAYENAKKQYYVRYEKSSNGRWVLAMS